MKINKEAFPYVKDEYLKDQEKLFDLLLKDFGPDILSHLASRAAEARKNAYAPYSNYQVGAAVLTTDGRIFEGVNAEAVSFTQTAHAEETAIRNAILAGVIHDLGQHFIVAIVFVSSNNKFSAPCGHCRQIIREHAQNCVVAQGSEEGEVKHATTLNLLLPLSFSSIS